MAEDLNMVGTWRCSDPFGTDTTFEITFRDRVYDIRATDLDGDEAEISEVKVEEDRLTFGALWPSGQFTKFVLRHFGDGMIQATFTYNDKAIFLRQDRHERS